MKGKKNETNELKKNEEENGTRDFILNKNNFSSHIRNQSPACTASALGSRGKRDIRSGWRCCSSIWAGTTAGPGEQSLLFRPTSISCPSRDLTRKTNTCTTRNTRNSAGSAQSGPRIVNICQWQWHTFYCPFSHFKISKNYFGRLIWFVWFNINSLWKHWPKRLLHDIIIIFWLYFVKCTYSVRFSITYKTTNSKHSP